MIRTPLGCVLAALSLLVFALSTDARAAADLSITKSLTSPADVPGSGANPGDEVVFTITVTNNGDAVINGDETATSVQVTDTSFTGLSFVSNSGDCTTSFPCLFPSISYLSSRTIVSTWLVTATGAPPTAARNFAQVSATSSDPVSSNNGSVAYVPINGINCGNFAVSGGTSHTCAVVAGNGKPDPNTLDDYVLECWGGNFNQQTYPVPEGFYSQVSAGALFTCALDTDGFVVCWGENGLPGVDQIVTNAPADPQIQIDSGFYHACAVDAAHEVTCWGDNRFGQSNIPPDTLFVQVAANNIYSCGLTTQSTVVCWGDDGLVGVDPIVSDAPTDNDFVQIVAGGEHACARHEDGTVECWGTDYSGETADPSGEFLSVTAGDEHNCGLRSDNTAECWGDLTSGVPSDAFTSIDSGAYHTCGLISDGSILCWGDNELRKGIAPGRSDLCPTCGDGEIEGRENCEACQGLGTPTPCAPLEDFDICCSPVTCTAYRLTENHVCRAGTGSCDAPEVCNGIDSDTCPPEGPLRPTTFVCRPALGSCDPDEFCTGTSDVCPPNGPLQPSSYVCRTAAGSCDIAENCTGTDEACPADVVKVASTLCRDIAGGCDVAESCTGADALCPADAFLPAPTPCRPTDGVCDVAENCSGTEAACPTDAFLSASTECRPSGGICDNGENCTGAAADCPTDILAPTTQVCRPLGGGCDTVERCTSGGPDCPSDTYASAGTTCRASAGVCDVAETCAGGTPACAGDTLRPSTFACRGSSGVCDVVENCTGGSPTCPANGFQPNTTPCRAQNGVCDVVENCTGNAAACPANGFAPSTQMCRAQNGVCDVSENCTGANPNCPGNGFAPSTQMCRAQNGVCDVSENCTGANANCPGNGFAQSTLVCRPQNGVCDQSESCTGGNANCPANTFRSASVVCRSAVDVCDVDENCTGGAGACPTNAFAGTSTVCIDGLYCNGIDTCDGSGACTVHAGDPCPGPDGDGDCAESCSEGNDNCLADDLASSPCDDGSVCTTGDSCSAGTCQSGAPEDCDDGILCTVDTCDEVEGCQNIGTIQEAGCYEAGKFSFALRDTGLAEKNTLKWGWKKGAAFDPADLGTPATDTGYALCIFDENGGEPQLVGSYVVPGGGTDLWLQKDDQVKYSDKPGSQAGVTGLKVKASTAGKSGAQLKAVGVHLDLPAPLSGTAYFAQNPTLTVQLRNDAGACWTSEFTSADRNTGFQFKAVGP
jgi:uncharacterized repeat protein (TIGR01451 family)